MNTNSSCQNLHFNQNGFHDASCDTYKLSLSYYTSIDPSHKHASILSSPTHHLQLRTPPAGAQHKHQLSFVVRARKIAPTWLSLVRFSHPPHPRWLRSILRGILVIGKHPPERWDDDANCCWHTVAIRTSRCEYIQVVC